MGWLYIIIEQMTVKHFLVVVIKARTLGSNLLIIKKIKHYPIVPKIENTYKSVKIEGWECINQNNSIS